MKVVTVPGGTRLSPTGKDAAPRLTEAQAESICRRANAAAEKLGIKTRYEVRA